KETGQHQHGQALGKGVDSNLRGSEQGEITMLQGQLFGPRQAVIGFMNIVLRCGPAARPNHSWVAYRALPKVAKIIKLAPAGCTKPTPVLVTLRISDCEMAMRAETLNCFFRMSHCCMICCSTFKNMAKGISNRKAEMASRSNKRAIG